MLKKSVGSWFQSDLGRKCMFGVATTAGMSAFCIQYLPHSFFLDKYQNVVHYYRNGIKVPLPSHLLERFNKAIELSEVSESTKKLYSAFSVVGFDIFSAGSSYSKFGCIIGLPINFTYDNVDTIEKHNIKILSESVVWDSKDAKDFLNSQVLSEKAQIYAMAREMRMTQTMKLYVDSMISTMSVALTYAFSNYLNMQYNLHAKPLGVRLVMYGLVGSFWFANYCLLSDFTQLRYERQVDEELKHLNPIFVEGAIEFYDKILQRNKALRKLMGKDGENMYSVHGNENYMVRQRHLPLVQRKSYFENTLDPKESLIKEYV